MYCFNSGRLNMMSFLCSYAENITYKTFACADNNEFRACGYAETTIDVVTNN